MNAYPISGAAGLHERGCKVKGNAVVAFRFHADYHFGEGQTRETNAAGYLMTKVPRNQNLVVGVKMGVSKTRVRVLVLDRPLTWPVRSRQDRQIVRPTRF